MDDLLGDGSPGGRGVVVLSLARLVGDSSDLVGWGTDGETSAAEMCCRATELGLVVTLATCLAFKELCVASADCPVDT